MTSGETENTNTQNQLCPARARRATPSAGRQLRAASALVPVLLSALLGPASAAAEQRATAQPANPIRLAQASEIREFSIRPQPLASALDRFSEATGISFAYTTSQLDGIRSPGVSGALPPRQALAQLLAGTGITSRFTSADTVTLAVAQEGDGPLRTGPILVGGDAASGTGPVEGFRAETSSSATNVDAPLIETPATVNVLTGDFIDTIGARSLEDTLAYVPGASSQNLSSTATGFNIRGFQSLAFDPTFGDGGGSVRVDGFRAPAGRYHYDLALYERIDILKGGSSMLYGTASPGGMVQFVTKKPEFEQRTSIEGTIGSFDTSRITLDATGPFVEGGDLAYRLIATGLNSNLSAHGDSDDISSDDRFIINPQLAWRTPGGGLLRASYEYSQRDSVLDPGIKRLADGSFTFNTQPFLGSDTLVEFENHIGMVEFTQPLGENWEVSLAGAIGRSDIDSFWDYAAGDPNGANQVGRFTSRVAEEYASEEIRAELNGAFNTGEQIRHQFTIGASYLHAENDWNQQGTFLADAIDATNPQFGAAPDPSAGFDFPLVTGLEEKAVYIQDFISVGEKLTVFGGLRYTDAENTFETAGGTTGADESLDYTIGAIYNQNHWLNPFVSYSTSLTPQTGALLGSDEAIPFREGEQIEIGLKSEWFDGRMTTTASVFQIEQTNIAQSAPPPEDNFSILVGDQRTRGVEFEAVGKITDQVSIFGGYSYLDAEFTESTTDNDGNTPHSVPTHMVSLFGQYEFTGQLEGWRAGSGLIHVGERQGNNANTYELPTFERVDAFVGYRKAGFDFRLSVENVLNEDYVSSSDGDGGLFQGAPRFFTLTAGWEF